MTFLILKKLIGRNVSKHHTNIDLNRTMKTDEFFDARGASGSRSRLTRKIAELKKRLKKLRDRKTRYLANVAEKKSKLKVAEKETSAKQMKLEDLQAKTASAQAEVDAAKRNEEEAQNELSEEKIIVSELDNDEIKLMEDLVFDENSLVILNTMTRLLETEEDRAKLLLSDASAKDCRHAASKLVPSFEALCSEYTCPKDTIKKALNFLHLNGVADAKVPVRETNTVLLRKQLAKILYPEIKPIREASLSPKSKETALAEELYDDAALVEKKLKDKRQDKRQAKRKSDISALEPPAKKRKPSEFFPAQAKEKLEPSARGFCASAGHDASDSDSDHDASVADAEQAIDSDSSGADEGEGEETLE